MELHGKHVTQAACEASRRDVFAVVAAASYAAMFSLSLRAHERR